jgi:hypothetical protein
MNLNFVGTICALKLKQFTNSHEKKHVPLRKTQSAHQLSSNSPLNEKKEFFSLDIRPLSPTSPEELIRNQFKLDIQKSPTLRRVKSAPTFNSTSVHNQPPKGAVIIQSQFKQTKGFKTTYNPNTIFIKPLPYVRPKLNTPTPTANQNSLSKYLIFNVMKTMGVNPNDPFEKMKVKTNEEKTKYGIPLLPPEIINQIITTPKPLEITHFPNNKIPIELILPAIHRMPTGQNNPTATTKKEPIKSHQEKVPITFPEEVDFSKMFTDAILEARNSSDTTHALLKIIEVMLPFLAPILPSIFSVTVTQPLDTIGANMQKNGKSAFYNLREITGNYKNIPKLWNGLTPPLIATVPQKSLQFLVYQQSLDPLESLVRNDGSKGPYAEHKSLTKILAAIISAIPDSGSMVLSEIFKINRQVGLPDPKLSPKLIMKVLTPLYTRDVVAAVAGFTLAETINEKLLESLNLNKEDTDEFSKLLVRIVSISFSIGVMQSVITPLDSIKNAAVLNQDSSLKEILKGMSRHYEMQEISTLIEEKSISDLKQDILENKGANSKHIQKFCEVIRNSAIDTSELIEKRALRDLHTPLKDADLDTSELIKRLRIVFIESNQEITKLMEQKLQSECKARITEDNQTISEIAQSLRTRTLECNNKVLTNVISKSTEILKKLYMETHTDTTKFDKIKSSFTTIIKDIFSECNPSIETTFKENFRKEITGSSSFKNLLERLELGKKYCKEHGLEVMLERNYAKDLYARSLAGLGPRLLMAMLRTPIGLGLTTSVLLYGRWFFGLVNSEPKN